MFVRARNYPCLDLSDINFSGVDFTGVNLSGSRLARTNLSGANLIKADLSGALLDRTDLSYAELPYANLSYSNLFCANLVNADLRKANLSNTILTGAILSGADFSGCIGMPKSPVVFHEVDSDGVIAYRAFGNTDFDSPENWVFEEGAYIEEPGCNPDRFSDCGSGVSVASTLDWVKRVYPRAMEYWKVRIMWCDLPNTVVPFSSTGKYRTTRIQLIERV